MDVDRYLALHQPTWTRLGELTARAQKGAANLSADELDELIQLYQRTSSHLSHARAQYADPALTSRLTTLVARASGVIYGSRARSWRNVSRFFADSFPAAVWTSRRFVLVSALLTFVPAIAVGAWLANSDAALEAAAPEAVRQVYVDEEFEAYYSSEPAAQFAASVTVNNIQVSILAFAAGVALCLGTAAILVFNGANVGVAAGLFASAGASARFYGLILPHGLLELTAVVVAGGAGLRLGWTVIAPGDRSRGSALAEEGRRSVVIVLGLVLAFIVAGAIEGFVTGSALPTAARVGLGVLVELTFLTYIVVRGRAAVARGLTGAIGEVPTVAQSSRSLTDALSP